MTDIKIIYSDQSLLVCVKPAGVPCESANEKVKSLTDILKEQLCATYVGMVHRLDQVTEGLMVYSLSERATGKLSEYMASGEAHKEYLAVVHGIPDAPEGEMRDLLYRDARKNKSFVVDRKRAGVKEAKLEYTPIATAAIERGTYTLVRVKLHTGRFHQIRAQLSSRGMPIVGDGKYGSHDNRAKMPALFSSRLGFTLGTKSYNIKKIPDKESYPWSLFDEASYD